MEDNLARNFEVNMAQQSVAVQQPYQRPLEEVKPVITPGTQAVPVAKGLTKFEKLLITVFGIIVFGLVLMNIQSSLQMANASRSVQDVNTAITQTEVEIENLKQQSYELSRYDRINEIAQKFGLELHDENIVNIAPQE